MNQKINIHSVITTDCRFITFSDGELIHEAGNKFWLLLGGKTRGNTSNQSGTWVFKPISFDKTDFNEEKLPSTNGLRLAVILSAKQDEQYNEPYFRKGEKGFLHEVILRKGEVYKGNAFPVEESDAHISGLWKRIVLLSKTEESELFYDDVFSGTESEWNIATKREYDEYFKKEEEKHSF